MNGYYVVYTGLNNEYKGITIMHGLKTKEGVYKRFKNNIAYKEEAKRLNAYFFTPISIDMCKALHLHSTELIYNKILQMQFNRYCVN